jgi:hypothetical protein
MDTELLEAAARAWRAEPELDEKSLTARIDRAIEELQAIRAMMEKKDQNNKKEKIMSQQFVFNNKGGEYFRAQTRHLRGFENVIQWFSQQQGVRSRGQAIDLARKTRPELYNEWMAGGRRQRMAADNKPVHTLSMRTRSGAPLIRVLGW